MLSIEIEKELNKYSKPDKKIFFPKFFKAKQGEYGEGDHFLGVMVPDIRRVVKKYSELPREQLNELLHSEYHESRLCALLILVCQFKKADHEEKKSIVEYYLENTDRINNWDLVDLSSKDIIGEYLLDKDRQLLYQLAESSLLWEQRIAIVSTYAFIRRNDFVDTLFIASMFLNHPHPLIHKATGWMLREVGKRDKTALLQFLNEHYKIMPRTMLRYSIERLTIEEKYFYMTS